MEPEDGHYQAPKYVAVPYVENTLYSTNKYSCVRQVNTLYIGYCLKRFELCVSGTRFWRVSIETNCGLQRQVFYSTLKYLIDLKH